jgi:alkylhydroperoxidase family enzyme
MDIRHAVGVKVGIPVQKVAALTSYKETLLFTERERAALEFSEQISRGDQEVSGECFSRLRQHFSEPEIVELTFIIGYQTFASKFAKAFRLEPQGFSPLYTERSDEAQPGAP